MIFNFPSFGMGFVLGFGTGYASRELSDRGVGALRPLGKSLVKVALRIGEGARESFAALGETFEDLVAEAQAEAQPVKVKSGGAKAQGKRKIGGRTEGEHGAAGTVH